jgi:hypothetical protein
MIMANHAIEFPLLRPMTVLFAVPTHGQAPQPERHLANVKQLTAGGENAEAYFSPDGTQLIYQTTPGAPGTCDQIFTMNVDGSNKRQLSKGGRTTCGYFFPDGNRSCMVDAPGSPGVRRGRLLTRGVWPIYGTTTSSARRRRSVRGASRHAGL